MKQRKPRTKKVAAQVDPLQVARAASDSVDATAGKPRRGRKAKTIPAASLAKSKPLNRVRKTTDAAPTTPCRLALKCKNAAVSAKFAH